MAQVQELADGAAPVVVTRKAGLNPLGREAVTVDATAGGVALTVPVGANYCLITPTDGDIYYADSSPSLTTANGFPLASGSVMEYDGDLSALRLLRAGGSDVDTRVIYYG